MVTSGEQSPAVVHTDTGLHPTVRRTRQLTLYYDADMYNRRLTYKVIDSKRLVTKYAKEAWLGPVFKKSLKRIHFCTRRQDGELIGGINLDKVRNPS